MHLLIKEKKVLMLLFLLPGILFTINLSAQDVLEEIVTWQVPEGSRFRASNQNSGGSDINNDGYDDFIHALFFDTHTKFQFYMGSDNPSSTFDFEVEAPYGSHFMSWGGDLNGNGFKDLVYSITTDIFYPGRIHICYGKEEGEIDLEPDFILHGSDYLPDPTGLNYKGFNGGYDFNGNGYNDLLAWGQGPSFWWHGLVQIFFGGEEMSAEPDFQLFGNSLDFLGNIKAVGDINGDGYDDLIISRSIGEGEYDKQFEVYLGGETMSTTPHFVTDMYSTYFGPNYEIPIGDINNDGYDDILIPGVGIFMGNEEGVLNLDFPDFGFKFININGNEYTDVIHGAGEHLEIYYGSEDFDATNPDILFYYDDTFYGLCNAGDITGNGRDEFLISTAESAPLANSVTLYGLSSNSADDYTIHANTGLSNYPNPFNPETTISFDLPVNVENPNIEIFNIKGELIRKLNIRNSHSLATSIVWDGTDKHRNRVSSGVYLYRIKTDEGVLESQKMLLMK